MSRENVMPAEPLVALESASTTFNMITEMLQKSFYRPDMQAIRIVMGTMQAHYLKTGDPAWMFIVAPPGSGKTTTSMMTTSGLPEVTTLSDFTEATFLSGFYGHDSPGLLERVGKSVQSGDGRTFTAEGNAIFMAKDFTTVLAMKRETRNAILGQLREIHDGEFKRTFGTGQTKIWKGRVTMLAAVTPVLDRYYSIFSTLGERFLQVRWHRPDSPRAGVMAINQQGKELEIREELAQAVRDLFEKATKKVPEISDEFSNRIASISELVAIGRTHVFRANYGNREIEYMPEPESNTRLSKGLAALARGIASLNQRTTVGEADFQDVLRVAFDCIPEYRRLLLQSAIYDKDPADLEIPPTMQRREIENLSELGLLTPEGNLSRSARELVEATRIPK